MTERIKRMKKAFDEAKFPICPEKIQIFWDTFQKYGNRRPVVWRSKYQAELLNKISIFIEDDDLICGNGASKPNGLETDYEYGIWTRDELEMLLGDDQIFTVDPDDLEIIVDIMQKITDDERIESTVSYTGKIVGDDPRLWPFMHAGVTLPPWKDKVRGSGGGNASSGLCIGPGAGLLCVDYDKIIKEGARSIIDEAKECLANNRYYEEDSVEKKEYWEGLIDVYEAWINYAKRHADLAEKMAKECKDEKRKAELLEMARICRKCPEHGADTFREALQIFWLTFLMMVPFSTASPGRFDQYMYPYYKADIEAGRITNEEVVELLEIIRIKCMKLNGVSGSSQRKRLSGNAKWYNMAIAGVKRDGSDATNELSYLVLDAAADTLLPHNTMTIRVAKSTPIELIKRGVEVMSTGIGMPAFVSDEVYTKYFTTNGMAVEDARNFILSGCLDANVPTRTRTTGFLFFVIPLAFEIFMHNGFCPRTQEMVGIETGDVTKIATFEEFKETFYKQLDYLLGLGCERNNIECSFVRRVYPSIFPSALMVDGIKSGRPVHERRMEPMDNGACMCMVGGIDTADSLTAVKKLVYDEKKYTMKQLYDALEANWEGYEEMRKDFVNVPKYGNDIDEPDMMVADLYDHFTDALYPLPHVYGDHYRPAGISISAHGPGGELTGALPNGHYAHECLTDGCMSPARGADKNGFLAVFKSAMKVNQDAYQATLMNMKFSPSALKSDEDKMKLAQALKVYLTEGGRQVQFNVVKAEDMLDAKVHPEDHKELIVRVAGYSAYFTALTNNIQDEVIGRTEFQKV